MFLKIRKKIKKDNGDASFILGLMLIMLLLLVGGTLLDFSKAYQLKGAYIDSARKATQSAIMEQNSRGYLKETAIARAIITYENISRAYSINRDGVLAKCPDYGDSDVILTITLFDESGHQESFSINRANVPRLDGAINMSPQQIKQAEKTVAEMLPSGLRQSLKSSSGFKPTQIQLDVIEGTQNLILPAALTLNGANGNGAKCQKLTISEKATIFQGEKDQFN